MDQSLSPSRLNAGQLKELGGIVGNDHVSIDLPTRLVHSRDMWPPTVIQTKEGRFPCAPDVVVSPRSADEIAELLIWARHNAIPVIPYGAGSGVCGGTLPLKGGIILNLKRMADIVAIDAESLVAEIEPGIYGETLERRLNPLGYTMGHFPSSIYCSTLGGYLAARSAGQMSSRYGKIEDMVVGLEFVLPDGTIHRTLPSPSGLARSDWNQILIGSEGTLGVITKAWMRIHPAPKHRCFMSYHFPGIDSGLDMMRKIMQAGLEPSVLRLYDEFDTLVAASHGTDGSDGEEPAEPSGLSGMLLDTVEMLKKGSLGKALKKSSWLNRAASMLPGKCLLIVLTEGEKDMAEHEAERVREICRSTKGTNAGEGPARYWLKHRHSISYKQSKIFDAGGWVDTMEVATTWRDIVPLYHAVKKAVRDDVFIMAHFSHAYRDGCCIYFSFAAAESGKGDMESRYRAIWDRTMNVVSKHHGTITHHHGVGLNKGPMLRTEYGDLWPIFEGIKHEIDPENIMNPGKLGLEA